MTLIRRFSLCASVFMGLLPAGASADTLSMELIQSIPEQTETLTVPGMKHTTPTWVGMVDQAKTSIDLSQMYLSNTPDRTGPLELVIQALERAALRGVKIRLILSKQMSGNDPVSLERFQKMKGAEVRILDLGAINGGIQHAKYWVIDGDVSFVGSQNFDWRALNQIHELGVLVRHEETARRLRLVFNYDWELAITGKAPDVNGSPILEPLASDVDLFVSPIGLVPAGMRATLPNLLELLKSAKSTIQIQLLDYSPVAYANGFWAELDNALRDAAARNVKVELLVSHWNTEKPAIHHLKSLSLIPGITVKVSTVPEHTGGFIPYARVIHCKFTVVDGKTALIGTTNWSRGYFYGSRNVDFVVSRPEVVSQAQAVFTRGWTAAFAVPVDVARDYPKPRKGE